MPLHCQIWNPLCHKCHSFCRIALGNVRTMCLGTPQNYNCRTWTCLPRFSQPPLDACWTPQCCEMLCSLQQNLFQLQLHNTQLGCSKQIGLICDNFMNWHKKKLKVKYRRSNWMSHRKIVSNKTMYRKYPVRVKEKNIDHSSWDF